MPAIILVAMIIMALVVFAAITGQTWGRVRGGMTLYSTSYPVLIMCVQGLPAYAG